MYRTSEGDEKKKKKVGTTVIRVCALIQFKNKIQIQAEQIPLKKELSCSGFVHLHVVSSVTKSHVCHLYYNYYNHCEYSCNIGKTRRPNASAACPAPAGTLGP